jgi:UDP-N-acetylglucosamine--N-acetylmuramyl-(pentapeptide) pyrophosphoryl-undecaprenol N-acetylglucosamine transferase
VTKARTFALICGGGTAGHVSPALAIADALVDAGHPRDSLHYVGSERGIEATVVPKAGLPLTLLPGRGLRRSLTPASMVANVVALAGTVAACARAVALVRRLRPAVVVAVGGYASVPCALAAILWRVPIVVAEQNVHPGASNRFVARFARASAVAFDGTPLPRAVVTGNPVRPEIVAVDRGRDSAAARAELGIEDGRSVVLATGGSLGALRINQAVVDAISGPWRDRADLAVRHVVGSRDWDGFSAAPAPATKVQYLPVRYEDDMPRALAAADVAVCRAGSGTCFELAAVGLPAVLVPSPHVVGDHQTANARHLAAAGGAVVVSDAELDGARLAVEFDRLLTDPDRREAMAKALHALARPDAAAAVAALAERHARG